MSWTDSITNTTKVRQVHISELRTAIESLEAACPTHNSSYYTSYNKAVYSNDGHSLSYSTLNSTAHHQRSVDGVNSTNNAVSAKGPCYLPSFEAVLEAFYGRLVQIS
jgi:hypothetical protein